MADVAFVVTTIVVFALVSFSTRYGALTQHTAHSAAHRPIVFAFTWLN